MTATDLHSAALAWLSASAEAIVVEVVEAHGSVPRDAGTRMLVSAGEIRGTIGGGHLELKAITAARSMLAGGERSPRRERFALGPSLGQCCGGAVVLAFASLDAATLARWPTPQPLFHLQLHGAGHVGRAIATLLATIDCRVDWFDQRDDGFPATTTLGSPWPAHIRRIAIDTVEAEVRQAPAASFYLVLTHEHALDLRITEQILRRADFAYLGLIGSKTKRASFGRRLVERGIDRATLSRLTCPIGLGPVGGREPELIAVAVVAQLVSVASAAATAAGSRPDLQRSRRGADARR